MVVPQECGSWAAGGLWNHPGALGTMSTSCRCNRLWVLHMWGGRRFQIPVWECVPCLCQTVFQQQRVSPNLSISAGWCSSHGCSWREGTKRTAREYGPVTIGGSSSLACAQRPFLGRGGVTLCIVSQGAPSKPKENAFFPPYKQGSSAKTEWKTSGVAPNINTASIPWILASPALFKI